MADTLKLIELTEKPWDARWKALSQFLLKHDVSLQTAIIEATPESLGEAVKNVLGSDAQLCRLSPRLSSFVFGHIPQKMEKSAKVGAADLLKKDKGGWWPQSCLVETFLKVLSQRIGLLDLTAPALVIGVDGAARQIVGALARTGFARVNVVEASAEAGPAFVREMKSQYFQVALEHIPFESITTLPGIHSLVVNTLPLEFENELLDEIYFFNFLRESGVVVDFNLIPSATPMIEEAKQLGARHLSGDFIAAEQDLHMIELALGRKFPVEEYRVALRAEADAVPYDIAPFLKRFRDRGS